jgi:hypothetical protein
MAAKEPDWDRLAELVRERRVELGMTQEDARSAGGPSTATMRLLEGALQRSYQPSTLRDLEKVLQWERGSVRRILAGGDPSHASAFPSLPSLTAPPSPAASGEAWAGPDLDQIPELAEAVKPYLEIIRTLADAAGVQPEDAPPAGSAVFGEFSPQAERWDMLAEAGWLDRPGAGWTAGAIMKLLAVRQVRDAREREQQRGGRASSALIRA